ncbi:MAG: CCA tRNA nucleotidyltransferase, partial [Verrucomicrobiaceae bacterium]
MRQAAVQIVKTLVEAGHQAVFAGGCVRDMLLSVEPKDYDIATSARPEEVQSLFPKSYAVGAHFGVIIVRLGDLSFEVATFRRDGKYSDARRPDSVEFTDAEEDAKRRDFTVNGLFFDPLRDEVLDFVGGREDLQKQTLRAIGHPVARFGEDHLRLLRAVRFATTLGFQIEAQTWDAVCKLSQEIKTVSAERVRMELEKIFLHANRVRGFDLLVESGLMKAVLPEILDMQGCEQPPQFHPEGDVFKHTRIMLGLLPPDASLPLVLAVLFHDIAKPATFMVDDTGRIRFNGHDRLGADMTGDILRRLKFSNHVIDPTVEAVANHMAFKDVQQMRISKLKRFLARPTIEDELELHRVDCSSSHGMLDNYHY